MNEVTNGGGVSDLVQYQQNNYPDAIGSQLEIGDVCIELQGSVNCAWPYWVNELIPGTTGLTLSYKSGRYTDFASDLAAVNAPNAVLFCLDFHPALNIYGAQWMLSSTSGGFDLIRRVVAPHDIASAVARDGAQGRVVTAVSFDASGQANLMSYGWQGDTTENYDTQVAVVAPQGIAAAATALATDGYILTAFGGDDVDGYVLIGTKVHGDVLTRPFQVLNLGSQTGGQAIAGALPVGRVSWQLSPSDRGSIFMLEK